ncbi:amino acid adenylation domain-containing protein [Williamsia sterculiae]
MSAGQQQLLFLDELSGPSTDYLLVADLDLHDPLDADLLRAALLDVTTRHPVLRTVYPRSDGRREQRVLDPTDIGDLVDVHDDVTVTPFDLTADLPIRIALDNGATPPRLRITLHHIACDQESVPIILADLAAAYTRRHDEEPTVEHAENPAADQVQFARWQHHLLGGPDDTTSRAATELDFWSRRLADVPPIAPLPHDFPRPEVSTAQGELLTAALAGDIVAGLRKLTDDMSVTPLMALHAAVALSLEACGTGDIVALGTAVDGRTHHQLAGTVGYFVNTVVLATRVDVDDTFTDVVRRVRRDDVEAYDHRTIPFERVVEQLAPPRPLGVNPLFQVMIAQFDDRPLTADFAGDLARSRFGGGGVSAKFDLTFGIGRTHEGTDAISLVYDTELFTDITAQGLLDAVHIALAHGVRHPDERASRPVPIAAATDGPLPLAADQRRLVNADIGPEATLQHTIPGGSAELVYRMASRNDALRMVLDTAGAEPRLRVRDIAEVIADDPLSPVTVDIENRGFVARLADDGLHLQVHPLLIDPESWSLMGIDSSDARFTDYLRGAAATAADLDIVESGEIWLDQGDAAAEALESRPRALPTVGSTTGDQHAPITLRRRIDRPRVSLDLTDTTTGALIALARALRSDASDFAELVEVDEPDRDRRPGLVGHLRRRYPRLLTPELAGSSLDDARAQRDSGDIPHPSTFDIAGLVSPHTEGIFEEFPAPTASLTVSHGGAAFRLPTSTPVDAALVVDAEALELVVTVAAPSSPHAVTHLVDRWIDEFAMLLPELARPEDPADLLPRLSDAEINRLESVVGPARRVWPLSPLQTGLLFHLQAADDSDVYLSQTTVEIRGALDRDRLAVAADAAADAYPNVAVAFTELGGRTVQVVPERTVIPWTYATGTDLDAFTAAERAKPFDPHDPPLFRFGVHTEGPHRHHLVFTAEHILLDGWSIWRFLMSVLDSYTDTAAARSRPVTPFSTYLSWLQGRDVAEAKVEWSEYLGGIEEPTLVAPREQSLGATTARESRDHRFRLEPELSRQLFRTAEQTGVTLSTVFEVAWSLTLRHITGSDDVSFGSVVSGRPAEIDGIDTTIGLLFNTVPTRFVLDRSASMTQTLRDAQQRKLLHLVHPYVTLSELLQLSGHRALFDTLFVFQNTPVLSPDKPFGPPGREIYVDDVRLDDATHYPITVVVNPADPAVSLRVMYQADVISETRLTRWLDTYTRILTAIAEHPDGAVSRLDPLSPADRHLVLDTVNRTRHEVPEETVYDLLNEQAVRSAEHPAVRSGATMLTYADLVERANRLGRVLLAHGAGPEQRVALLLPRSEAMVVALFAVFAAHSAYVPIDAEHPAERIDHMVDAAEPTVILTDSSLVDRLPAHLRDDPRTLLLDRIDDQLSAVSGDHVTDIDRATPSSPDQLAYIIFTSGSTGRPKGVAVPYRGLTNMYYNHAETIFTPVLREQGGRRIKIAHTTSFSFDASWEQLLWLLAGHEVHVIDSDMRRDPPGLLSYFDTQRIDAFDVTPTYGDLLVDSGLLNRPRCRGRNDADDTGLIFVSLGGEAVGEKLWTALRDAPGVGGYNLYGPTEYTINALGADVADTVTPSVGRPIWNTRAYVLDSTLMAVGPDGVGELYLAGAGMARGYVAMPDRTAERFVACPFGDPGERMYRTGDLVRRCPDGTLDYLGRADDQIKIRGHRIEPAEIANVLTTRPGVARCAVVPMTGPSGSPELAAFVIADDEQTASDDFLDGLRRILRETLPSYMVPAAVTAVTELPLTVNGKLDVRALPEPRWAGAEGAHTEPESALEQAIADIVADLLGVDQVGRDDDFFVIGGHSLLAARLAGRIGSVVGRSLSIRDVYQNPTPAGLAAASLSSSDGGSLLAPVLTLREGSGPTVVCFQPAGGLAWSYMGLVRFLTGDESVIALQDAYLTDGTTESETFDALVDDQYRRLREAVPSGPYHLLGWSFGGQLAHEVGSRLQAAGEEVRSLTLLDSFIVGDVAPEPDPEISAAFADHVRTDSLLSTLDTEVQDRLISTHRRHLRLTASQQSSRFGGDALLICATEGLDAELDQQRVRMWSQRVDGELRVERVDLPHLALGEARGWNAIGTTVADHITREPGGSTDRR